MPGPSIGKQIERTRRQRRCRILVEVADFQAHNLGVPAIMRFHIIVKPSRTSRASSRIRWQQVMLTMALVVS
jgi:hypothetical protein